MVARNGRCSSQGRDPGLTNLPRKKRVSFCRLRLMIQPALRGVGVCPGRASSHARIYRHTLRRRPFVALPSTPFLHGKKNSSQVFCCCQSSSTRKQQACVDLLSPLPPPTFSCTPRALHFVRHAWLRHSKQKTQLGNSLSFVAGQALTFEETKRGWSDVCASVCGRGHILPFPILFTHERASRLGKHQVPRRQSELAHGA